MAIAGMPKSSNVFSQPVAFSGFRRGETAVGGKHCGHIILLLYVESNEISG